jgi:cytochrome c5
MKKLMVLSIIFLLVIMACHKKAIPTFTSRIAEPVTPVTTTNLPPDAEAGKTTFTARCNRCHGLPDPAKYTTQRWDGILSIMIPRARLTKEEGNNVTAYLKANAQK